MKKMFYSSIFILLFSFSIVYSFPCPRECICKPADTDNTDFTRMAYLMDCTSASLKDNKLIYRAQQWSIDKDRINDKDDDDSTSDYVISIDLSNSQSLKKFTDKTIQLSGFYFVIQSLLLTNQSNKFILDSKSFYPSIYENLRILNLSSCCKQIPKNCEKLLRPLKNLQVLDLSGSDMYKTCLKTADTISQTLTDLILRNNIYDASTFSNSSRLFDGVQLITGKLDLQNSRFQMGSQLEGSCIFNIFREITTLDLSSIQFESTSDNIEIHLTNLLKCDNQTHEQVFNLYLRNLKLQRLPSWFTNDSFPFLRQLDLSNNNFASIDIISFNKLTQISLAYNPIDLWKIKWRQSPAYTSINLRSTARNRTFNLFQRLENLFKITKDLDYSENQSEGPSNVTQLPVKLDFAPGQFSLNISRTNLNRFDINLDDLRRLDVSWNSLTELNLDNEIKLNYLDCSNQYLGELILNDQIGRLNELKCSNNSLTKITNFGSSEHEQLKIIDLSYNSIDSLAELFLNLQSRFLRTVNLKSNFIELVPSNIFHEKLISLYEIDLSWNKIDKIEKFAFQAPNLQILDLTGNPLQNVEPQAILTASLRLFFLFNDTQQLIDRCERSKSKDNLLSMYVNWFQSNGTLMKKNPIGSNKCLKRYATTTQTKIDKIIKKGKHVLGGTMLYIVTGAILVGLFAGGNYFYRKNKLAFLAPFQRYKKLDRSSLVENAAEMAEQQQQREDDEIVMNLEEPPYNKYFSISTKV